MRVAFLNYGYEGTVLRSDKRERGEEGVTFSIGTRSVRKAAEPTVDGIWDAIGHIDRFMPSGCANYLAAARYEPDKNVPALEPRCSVMVRVSPDGV